LNIFGFLKNEKKKFAKKKCIKRFLLRKLLFFQMSVVKYMRTIKESRNSSTTYSDWLFGQKQFGRLFQIGMWPSFKEFTECSAGFHGVLAVSDPSIRSNNNVVCYCIGDGHRPQMAAMISGLTAWKTIFSIDPLLCVNKWEKFISSKITMCKMVTEEFKVQEFNESSISIVIAIHSHANFNNFWHRIPKPAIGVCVPCCVSQEVENETPCMEYIDLGIVHSPMNAVMIWKK
jgi:hypothetical protein